jgi:hypothetical protein
MNHSLDELETRLHQVTTAVTELEDSPSGRKYEKAKRSFLGACKSEQPVLAIVTLKAHLLDSSGSVATPAHDFNQSKNGNTQDFLQSLEALDINGELRNFPQWRQKLTDITERVGVFEQVIK